MSSVSARTIPLGFRSRVPGAASVRRALLGERTVILAQVDASVRKGALSPADGETLAAAAALALDQRLPLVVILASSGADVHDGIAALHGWGLAANAMVKCSGIVPVLIVLDGPSLSGPSLLLGLADQVVMTSQAYAFLSGPRMVQQFTGVPATRDVLGGPAIHARRTGVASHVCADRQEAIEVIEEILSFLPSHNDEEPPQRPTADPADRPTPEAGTLLPATSTGSYDVLDVIRVLVDDGEICELHSEWAANMVTVLANVAGRPIGVVANQPSVVAGTLDIPASQKGAGFVAFCDSFNLPIVTLIDTPGFYPGKDLEWRGMIRHGAQLAFAYARATVPRVSLTLRKSYGGAYIVMDSRRIGNDLALAWPSAQIAVMGAKGAVEILHRRESDERRRELEDAYGQRLLNPYIATERGLIDAVITPAETRRELASALETLDTKREQLVARIHDNGPL